MSYERRIYPRKVLRRPVLVRLPGGEVVKGKTQDVSQGGMCLLLPVNVPSGTACDVAFELPLDGKDHRITASARVVHAVMAGLDGFRTGLQFSNIGEADSERLRQFIW